MENYTKKIEFETLKNNSNDSNNKKEVQKFYRKLEEQEKKIEHLEDQLIGNIKYDDLKPDEKLLILNFKSKDKKIYYPIVCKTNTIFSEVESIFYKKYPDYGKNDGENTIFRFHGLKIKKFKTITEIGFRGFEITVEKKNLDK